MKSTKLFAAISALVLAALLLGGMGTVQSQGPAATAAATATLGATAAATKEPPYCTPAIAKEMTDKKVYIPLISKGFQHQFWQAVKLGAEMASKDCGVTITFEGPESESQVDKQIEMLQTALDKKPQALGFAALDSKAAIPLLQRAQAAKIPVVGFDSGVDSDIPVTTAATDNIGAAALAADKMVELIGGEGEVAVIAHDQTSRTGIDRVKGFTLPGFGTTSRTRANALALMRHLGVTAAEVDVRRLCLEEMRALGHRPFGIELEGLTVEELTARLQRLPADARKDLVFENVQARMRTSILMNAGFVVGTGDVSELALGWCTYNGDHMSMYNPNVSIPKTLVKFLVRWAAENEFDGEARRILLDVVATEISPELLPTGADGQAMQATEATIGPYELQDFFLFQFLRYGASPGKVLFLAEQARFDRAYTPEELRRWLRAFLERFFGNQFKRSCLPDGPKVGSISLSPRGDWRMPSDAQVTLWLREMQ